MRALLFLVLPLLAAGPAAAESLYKCTDKQGAVSIQSEPCPAGSTQAWKRDATPEAGPSVEELAARAALAEIIQPEDVARAAWYLGVDATKTTGELLAVDAGAKLIPV